MTDTVSRQFEPRAFAVAYEKAVLGNSFCEEPGYSARTTGLEGVVVELTQLTMLGSSPRRNLGRLAAWRLLLASAAEAIFFEASLDSFDRYYVDNLRDGRPVRPLAPSINPANATFAA